MSSNYLTELYNAGAVKKEASKKIAATRRFILGQIFNSQRLEPAFRKQFDLDSVANLKGRKRYHAERRLFFDRMPGITKSLDEGPGFAHIGNPYGDSDLQRQIADNLNRIYKSHTTPLYPGIDKTLFMHPRKGLIEIPDLDYARRSHLRGSNAIRTALWGDQGYRGGIHLGMPADHTAQLQNQGRFLNTKDAVLYPQILGHEFGHAILNNGTNGNAIRRWLSDYASSFLTRRELEAATRYRNISSQVEKRNFIGNLFLGWRDPAVVNFKNLRRSPSQDELVADIFGKMIHPKDDRLMKAIKQHQWRQYRNNQGFLEN